MTRVSIMQPTYLPWSGYFAMMMQVDHFIFLEDVEFSYQSWQQRNRIKTSDGTLWLTVPVHSSGGSDDLIRDVKIVNEENWRHSHLRSIELNYKSASFFHEFYPGIKRFIEGKQDYLSNLTIPLIVELGRALDVDCTFHHSSDMKTGSGKVSRLVELCKRLDADEYLAPVGSYNYLKKSREFEKSSVQLFFLDFEHPTYTQLNGEFVSHLSVVDLLFNTGKKARDIIQKGLRPPQDPDRDPAV